MYRPPFRPHGPPQPPNGDRYTSGRAETTNGYWHPEPNPYVPDEYTGYRGPPRGPPRSYAPSWATYTTHPATRPPPELGPRPPAGPAPSWNGEGYGPHPYHWPTRDPYAERPPHEPEMRLNMARWAGAARRYGSVIWNDQELPQLTEQALASTPHRKWIEQVLQKLLQ